VLSPRVIYINVLKDSELLTLQTDLMADLETLLGIVDPVSKTRAFHADRCLSRLDASFRQLGRNFSSVGYILNSHLAT